MLIKTSSYIYKILIKTVRNFFSIWSYLIFNNKFFMVTWEFIFTCMYYILNKFPFFLDHYCLVPIDISNRLVQLFSGSRYFAFETTYFSLFSWVGYFFLWINNRSLSIISFFNILLIHSFLFEYLTYVHCIGKWSSRLVLILYMWY